MEVFYYFSNIAAAIEKAAGLLAGGGLLAVLVNHHKDNPESYSWPRDLGTPMVLWSREQYADAFKAAGLSGVEQCVLPDPDNAAGTLCTLGYKQP